MRELALKTLKKATWLGGSEVVRNNKGATTEWMVLDIDIDKKRVLMTTKDCIADKPWGKGTWEECDLRRWLNCDFYFSIPAEARMHVAVSEVRDLDVEGKRYVEDKVFILDPSEVSRYLGFNRVNRVCNACGISKGSIYDSWWLRKLAEPRFGSPHAFVVDNEGHMGSRREKRRISRVDMDDYFIIDAPSGLCKSSNLVRSVF